MGKASHSITKVRNWHCMVDHDGICNICSNGEKFDRYTLR